VLGFTVRLECCLIRVDLVQEEERRLPRLLMDVEKVAAFLALDGGLRVPTEALAERLDHIGPADQVSGVDEHDEPSLL
jgi:hypothetical protein